jgi:hypothetical protein
MISKFINKNCLKNLTPRFYHSLPTINGKNSTAIVLGGFGFTERALYKHTSLYNQYGFDVIPCLSSIKSLSTPAGSKKRGQELAEQVVSINQPTVCHFISGSFWTGIYMLEAIDNIAGKEWKDNNIKGIVFDSCPPKSDTLAFSGFVAYRFKNPNLKKNTAPFFKPYRWFVGINTKWENEFSSLIFGNKSIIPRKAHQLHIHAINDPVIDSDYISKFVDDCTKHRKKGYNIYSGQIYDTSITNILFKNTKHSRSLVDNPQYYKKIHNIFLGKIDHFK